MCIDYIWNENRDAKKKKAKDLNLNDNTIRMVGFILSPRRTKFIFASLGFSVHSAPHNEKCQGFIGSREDQNHWLAKMNNTLSIAGKD